MKICIICLKEFKNNSGAHKRCPVCDKLVCSFCGIKFKPRAGQYKMKFCSRKCYGDSTKGVYPVNLKGSRGIKPRTYYKRTRQYGSMESREWRIRVFERDGYTCQHCGQVGGKLNAHHIKPFKLCPELRFDIDNGLTLCLKCHSKTDSFGWQNYWKSQIAQKRISNTQEMML